MASEGCEPPVGRPARRAVARTPSHCPDPWRAGFRRGRPNRAPQTHRRRAARHSLCLRIRCSAITAACRVSAPSSREITAATSTCADLFGKAARCATCGSCAQAAPRAWHIVGLIDLVAERDRLLRAQPQQVARGDDAADLAVLVLPPRDGAASAGSCGRSRGRRKRRPARRSAACWRIAQPATRAQRHPAQPRHAARRAR